MQVIKTYIIPGDPIPLARARKSKAGALYDSQKNHKLIIGITLQSQMESTNPPSCPLLLDATFFMYTPKTKPKLLGQYVTTTPDLTNLLKLYEDVAQDIGLLLNDKLIAAINSRKIYDLNPRTELRFIPI